MNCPFYFFHSILLLENISCYLFSILEKIRKEFCNIHLKNWLNSRLFHYKFSFSQSHLVQKIENLVTDLPPQLQLGLQNCHWTLIFQNWTTPGKQENYGVKTFCSHQTWQIYITKYYCNIFWLDKEMKFEPERYFVSKYVWFWTICQNYLPFLHLTKFPTWWHNYALWQVCIQAFSWCVLWFFLLVHILLHRTISLSFQ